MVAADPERAALRWETSVKTSPASSRPGVSAETPAGRDGRQRDQGGLRVERLIRLDDDDRYAEVRARLVALSRCPAERVAGDARMPDLILAGNPARPAEHSEQLPKATGVTTEHRCGS